MKLAVGMKAPDFELPDENNQLHKLGDYKGKIVVLYFYPKDNTSGCTTEACNFRDDHQLYVDANATILGVSPDDPKSHTKFIGKYDLPFTLLADVDHQVCEAYGVWGRKKFMGKEYDGVFRTTFLIGPDGVIQHIFENVKPAKHSIEVLDVLGK